jgi:hypothetical protein
MAKNKSYLSFFEAPFAIAVCYLLSLSACKTIYNPTFPFDPSAIPAAPNYGEPNAWAALPQKVDLSDRVPKALEKIAPADIEGEADVFYIHPTTLTEARKEWKIWNGPLDDIQLNTKTDESALLFQASAFNAVGRVFAPRYRQAHYYSFFTDDKVSAQQALEVAYEDVKTAFLYYLEHYNEGRPFVIAAHSQGSKHGARLLKELVDTTDLRQQLVVAYLPGWPVPFQYFQNIPPSSNPEQIGCFCSWRTFEYSYGKKNARQPDIACTNPITWATDTTPVYVPKSMHKGAILYRFDQLYPAICDAETYKGVLLCSKPKFRGSLLLRTKNYHIGDINLYYLDIRENAFQRSQAFQKHVNSK